MAAFDGRFDMTGYTKVDNWLFDEAMPKLSPNAFKVLCVVARLTWGWQKESNPVSISRFQELAGIGNRNTVVRAVNECIDAGYMGRVEHGQYYAYHVIKPDNWYRNRTSTSTEIVLVDDPTSTEIVPLDPETSTEIVHIKEKDLKERSIKEKERKDNPFHWDDVAALMEHVSEQTGIPLPSLPNGWTPRLTDLWATPLVDLLKYYDGNIGEVRERLTIATEVLREKGYTIAGPRSLYNTALNVQLESVGAGSAAQDSTGGYYV